MLTFDRLWASASRQLSGDGRCFLRKIFAEHEIFRSHCIVSLPHEPFRGVVLRPRVRVERPIVDAVEVGVRPLQRRPDGRALLPLQP